MCLGFGQKKATAKLEFMSPTQCKPLDILTFIVINDSLQYVLFLNVHFSGEDATVSHI